MILINDLFHFVILSLFSDYKYESVHRKKKFFKELNLYSSFVKVVWLSFLFRSSSVINTSGFSLVLFP